MTDTDPYGDMVTSESESAKCLLTRRNLPLSDSDAAAGGLVSLRVPTGCLEAAAAVEGRWLVTVTVAGSRSDGPDSVSACHGLRLIQGSQAAQIIVMYF